jgi:hypothetical protein
MGLLKVAYSFTAQTPPMATLLVPIRGFRLVTHPIPLKKSPFRTILFKGLVLCKDQARPSTTVWFFGLECWPHYRGVGAKKKKLKKMCRNYWFRAHKKSPIMVSVAAIRLIVDWKKLSVL